MNIQSIDDQDEDEMEVKDKSRKESADMELPFCVTEMGPEQARGKNDSEPCYDYRTGEYEKGQEREE